MKNASDQKHTDGDEVDSTSTITGIQEILHPRHAIRIARRRRTPKPDILLRPKRLKILFPQVGCILWAEVRLSLFVGLVNAKYSFDVVRVDSALDGRVEVGFLLCTPEHWYTFEVICDVYAVRRPGIVPDWSTQHEYWMREYGYHAP